MTTRLFITTFGLILFAMYGSITSAVAQENTVAGQSMTIKLWGENKSYRIYQCADAGRIPSAQDRADVIQVCDTFLAIKQQIEETGAAKLEKYQKTVLQYLSGMKPIPILFGVNKILWSVMVGTNSVSVAPLGMASRKFYFPGIYGEPVISLNRDKTFSEKQKSYQLLPTDSLLIAQEKWDNPYGVVQETRRIKCPDDYVRGCTIIFAPNAAHAKNTLLHELLHIAKRFGLAPHRDVYRITDAYFPHRYENTYTIQPGIDFSGLKAAADTQ